MDRHLREAERAAWDDEPVRLALELLRAGRRSEALDRLAAAWGSGDPAARGLFLEVLESLSDADRLLCAPHLDRLACAGLEDAEAVWRRWFPEATRIVGAGVLSVREFLYQHAEGSEPLLLHGESGVGINLCAEVFHDLRGQGEFVREIVSAIAAPLWEQALSTLEAAPPGSTVFAAYAAPDQGPRGWVEQLMKSCAAKGSRAVFGGFRVEGWPSELVRCRVPPLRERFQDLPALTSLLLQRQGVEEQLTPEAVAHLRSHTWGGNVRELDCVLRRATTLADGCVSDALLASWIPGAQ